MRKLLKDKQGSSSLIYTIVVLIFLCILTLGIVTVMQFRSLALEIQHTANASLEEYVTVQAMENMDSIKNGNSYLVTIDENELIDYLANALGVDANLKGETSTGRRFEITNLDLTFDTVNEMDVIIEFDLSMPVEVSGVSFPPLETTITLYSELASKF